MYPTLPFGPLALPTGPVLAILATILTLDIAGRYGRRLRIHPDDIWNTGLIGLAAGLIVARLWNVFQFWAIYRVEPLLIISLRPSGFEFWPGLVAAFIAAYAYMLWRALHPLHVGAALTVGLAAGMLLIGVSGYATGTLLGTRTEVPWALPHLGEMRHPVGLYRGIAGALLSMILWIWGDRQRPGRTILMGILGYSLIRLITDTYLQNGTHIAGFRASQVIALIVAVAATLWLARTAYTDGEAAMDIEPETADKPETDSEPETAAATATLNTAPFNAEIEQKH